MDLLDQRRSVVDPGVDRHAGQFRVQGGEHDRGEGLDRADGQGGGVGGREDLVGQRVKLGQQPGGLTGQFPSGRGGPRTRGVALEQAGPQPAFQGRQPAGRRGLGGQQFLRGRPH
ncbi:hypothetical protein RKD44_001714 [Streptomyces collinus]